MGPTTLNKAGAVRTNRRGLSGEALPTGGEGTVQQGPSAERRRGGKGGGHQRGHLRPSVKRKAMLVR